MGWHVKAFAAKPDDLSSVPRTHTVKERTSSRRLSVDLHTRTVAHAYAHTYTKILYKVNNKK